MGPFDQAISWDPHGIAGTFRFLNKAWAIGGKKINKKTKNEKLERLLHKTIKKVSEDIELMGFNTAVSSLMIFVNKCYEVDITPLDVWENFLKILAPFAPHISEELWSNLGHKKSIFKEHWPAYNPKLIQEKTFELLIQINGKLRHKVLAPRGICQKEAEELVLAEEKIKKLIDSQKIKKIIFVADRLINIVH